MLLSKRLGGILLIIGTSIGGGMLALPIACAKAGLMTSILFLFLCWFIMTAGALLLLEINLQLPKGSNLISMASHTLGIPGKIFTWMVYLFLLYSLLGAYISGGSDVLLSLLHQLSLPISSPLATIVFTVIFGLVVYKGIRAVDFFNRGFMLGKLGVFILLLLLIGPYIHLTSSTDSTPIAIKESLMILITSFGFASIIPSLRDYFDEDIKGLRIIIILGSLIPLICYTLWLITIMGSLQTNGQNDLLISLAQSPRPTSGLIQVLATTLHNNWINGFFTFFSSICMITAFLGVSIGLFDFLADGLKLKKSGHQGSTVLMLTFLPPLLIVLFKPDIYLYALNYAGICCVFLLLILPTLMTYQARKVASIGVLSNSWLLSFVLGCSGYLLYIAIHAMAN